MSNALDFPVNNGVLARQLVKGINNPDVLASIVVKKEKHHEIARNEAAKKLLDMFLAGDMRCSSTHLAFVGDHADEPYKSQANDIIRLGLA